MSDKCEWKGGKFYPCDKFDGEMIYEIKKYDNGGINVTGCKCYHCHGEIQKPEPEVIIKKSGGTWVARYDGVDYLCLDVDMYSCEEDIFNEYKWQDPECMDDMWEASWWSPIFNVKITDEIAKLRPMIVHREIMFMTKLYGVYDDKKIIAVRGWTGDIDNFRLATVEDLA